MDAAAVAARLCEVGADGTSVLVSKGILNATRPKTKHQSQIRYKAPKTCDKDRGGEMMGLIDDDVS